MLLIKIVLKNGMSLFISKPSNQTVSVDIQVVKFHAVCLNFVQDLESEEATTTISYTKNGEDLGVAFTIPKEDLEEKVLCPHIIVKNTECQINAGAQVGWILNICLNLESGVWIIGFLPNSPPWPTHCLR
jgi:nitrogen fixation protein